MERRAFGEVRATGRTLHGIAAPFGQRADIGGFSETILPGAFAATLHRDIAALADHDATRLLGRTRSGSLRLTETRAGLEYSLDLPATSLGNDMLALAQRGDLAGVSIAFVAEDEAWTDRRTRQLRTIRLHEVSIITGGEPCYPDTSIALRHRGPMSAHARRARLLEMRTWV